MKRRFNILLLLFCVIIFGSCKKNPAPLIDGENVNGPASKGGLAVNAPFIHPGLLHTQADLIRMQTQVAAGAQPWTSGYNVLSASVFASYNYVITGPHDTIFRTNTGGNYVHVMKDAAAAYQNALMWKLTGNNAHADKAISILNAWATTCKAISGDSNFALASGLYGYQLANAGEILRTYSGWSATDFNKFKSFMTDVFYTSAHSFLTNHNGTCDTHYWANWDLCNIATVLAVGILCDDQAKFNEAINYFKSGIGNGNIDRLVTYVHPGNLGQNQESGRDQGHATLNISLVGALCQMAFNQGEDLFAYKNNKVLGLCEYTAKYNLNMDVPYTTYNNCDNVNQTVIAAGGRGTSRPSWELIYNHYVNIMGIPATYSAQFANQVRPEGGGGNYGSTSGGFDQLGFGTLTFTVGTAPLPNGTYRLLNKASGKYLDNLGATGDGANVSQYQSSASNNQKWAFTYNGGYYKLICIGNGKALDSYNHTADGSTVAQWPTGGSTNQQWTLIPVGAYYKIVNRTNGKCLDTGGSLVNSAPMQFWGSGGSNNQLWTIAP